jgi:NtrZ
MRQGRVFRLRDILLGVGVVIVTGAGVAHADPAKSAVRAQSPAGDIPWFERFTASAPAGEAGRTSSGTDQTITGMLSQKWGFSVNLRDADRSKTAARDEAAIGAFYDFTPRLRVGGELRVADPVVGGAPGINGASPKEPSAGVKLESAFRF